MTDRETDRWEKWVEQTMQHASLHEPPRTVLNRAIALGEGLVRPAGILRRWAECIMDTALQPAPVGVRKAAAGAERRILYKIVENEPSVEIGQIDLRLVRKSTGHVELTGQFLPPPTGGTVIISAGNLRRKSHLEPSGEFRFNKLPTKTEFVKLELLTETNPSLIIEKVPTDPSPEDCD